SITDELVPLLKKLRMSGVLDSFELRLQHAANLTAAHVELLAVSTPNQVHSTATPWTIMACTGLRSILTTRRRRSRDSVFCRSAALWPTVATKARAIGRRMRSFSRNSSGTA